MNKEALDIMIKNEKKYNNDSILDYFTDKISNNLTYEINKISENNILINHSDSDVFSPMYAMYDKFDIIINNVVIVLDLSNQYLCDCEKTLYELYKKYLLHKNIQIYLGDFETKLKEMCIFTFILNTRWFFDNYNNSKIELILKLFKNQFVVFIVDVDVNVTYDVKREQFNQLINNIIQSIFHKLPITSYRMILSHVNNLYKFRPGPPPPHDPFSGPMPLDDGFYVLITELINHFITNLNSINQEDSNFIDQEEQEDNRKEDIKNPRLIKNPQDKRKQDIIVKQKDKRLQQITESRKKPATTTMGGLKKTNKRHNKQKRNNKQKTNKNKTYKKRNKFSRKTNTNI